MDRPPSPQSRVGTMVPDLTLPTSSGGTFGLRSRVGAGPLVLFFFIRNGTPG